MRSRAIGWLVGICLSWAGCAGQPLLRSAVDAAGAGGQAGSVGDAAGSSCVGRDACACMADATCQPLATACYCPFPACGSLGACVCGGGVFLGCAPRASHCGPISCELAAVTGPDAAGCLSCDPAPTCETARARVAGSCGIADAAVNRPFCSYNRECVLTCLMRLSSCDGVACAFGAGDCSGTSSAALLNCYIGCQPI